MSQDQHKHEHCEQYVLAQLPDIAQRLSVLWQPPLVVYLHGNLGAGKTSLVRAILRVLGHKDEVPSPSFSLVETYEIERGLVHHFDLYRLEDSRELLHLGIKDFMTEASILVFEWPERGSREHGLPTADLEISLSMGETEDARTITWALASAPTSPSAGKDA